MSAATPSPAASRRVSGVLRTCRARTGKSTCCLGAKMCRWDAVAKHDASRNKHRTMCGRVTRMLSPNMCAVVRASRGSAPSPRRRHMRSPNTHSVRTRTKHNGGGGHALDLMSACERPIGVVDCVVCVGAHCGLAPCSFRVVHRGSPRLTVLPTCSQWSSAVIIPLRPVQMDFCISCGAVQTAGGSGCAARRTPPPATRVHCMGRILARACIGVRQWIHTQE